MICSVYAVAPAWQAGGIMLPYGRLIVPVPMVAITLLLSAFTTPQVSDRTSDNPYTSGADMSFIGWPTIMQTTKTWRRGLPEK